MGVSLFFIYLAQFSLGLLQWRLTLDAIDARRNNRYSVTAFLTVPRACQLTYVLYVRVVILGVLSRHSSIWRDFLLRYVKQTTVSTPNRSKITYYLYVGFCFGWLFPCSSSIWRAFTNGTIFIVISIEKNCYTVFHSKHLFLSIEKAERLNARQFLLFAVQIDFYAEIFVRKE